MSIYYFLTKDSLNAFNCSLCGLLRCFASNETRLDVLSYCHMSVCMYGMTEERPG